MLRKVVWPSALKIVYSLRTASNRRSTMLPSVPISSTSVEGYGTSVENITSIEPITPLANRTVPLPLSMCG